MGILEKEELLSDHEVVTFAGLLIRIHFLWLFNQRNWLSVFAFQPQNKM